MNRLWSEWGLGNGPSRCDPRSRTVSNLCESLDAEEFQSEELKKATHENLSLKHDRFGMQLLKGRL
jgi:hypothetical protein